MEINFKHLRTRSAALAVILTIILSGNNYSYNFIYVNVNAPQNGDGSSWAGAYNSLQDALDAALKNDTVLVAKGIYYPDFSGGIKSGNKNASFKLKNGVVILGGYLGIEDITQNQPVSKKYIRDWQLNKTILSGDLNVNDNDDITPDNPLRSDNSFHVITSEGTAEFTAELDGFYIESGNANDDGSFQDSRGGAIYASAGSMIIRNCIFRFNSALSSGGAVFSNQANAEIKFSIFENNFAGEGGGVSFLGSENPDDTLQPQIINSFFYNNDAELSGGAIHFSDFLEPVITGSVFSINTTADINSSGGGIYSDENSVLQVMNCTLYKNNAVQGAGITISAGTIMNSILLNEGIDEINNSVPAADPDNKLDVSYSIIKGGYAGTNVYDYDPLFVNPENQAGDDNLFGTADDGLNLSEASPAIDAGFIFSRKYQSDITGFPRISGNGIDLGAYEVQRYKLTLKELFDILTKGSNTFLFIHTLTVPGQVDDTLFAHPKDVNDSLFIYQIHDCDLQANISDEGIEQARYIGRAVKALNIQHDVVIASPMCRTKVTAREIFGLGSFLTSYSWMWADPKYSNAKKTKLGTVKDAGINSMLITHPDNIAEVTAFNEVEFNEGDLAVIQPLGGMDYTELTHSTTDTWEKLFKFLTPAVTQIESESLAADFTLYNNYPNPFNPATTIEYHIPSAEHVSLKIFDALGREVTELVNEVKAPGNYKLTFEASDLASGIYYYRLEAGEFNRTKKLMLLK